METLRGIAVTVMGPGGRTNEAERPASPHLPQDFGAAGPGVQTGSAIGKPGDTAP